MITRMLQPTATMTRFERAGTAFSRLCETMAKLRARCAWDREQTLASLKSFLLEETYEVLETIDRGDSTAHCEELGDLLLQIVFQAEITQEDGRFDVANVADAINEKLIRRHPHVFGDVSADDAAGALASWEKIKADERGEASSCLDGIPRALPALLRAQRTGEKAAAIGFDWPTTRGALDKVDEEWGELKAAGDKLRREEAGDLLFALVSLCRHWKINPEDALTEATDKFQTRFRYVEKTLAADGKLPRDLALDALSRLWEDAKSRADGNGPKGR